MLAARCLEEHSTFSRGPGYEEGSIAGERSLRELTVRKKEFVLGARDDTRWKARVKDGGGSYRVMGLQKMARGSDHCTPLVWDLRGLKMLVTRVIIFGGRPVNLEELAVSGMGSTQVEYR